MFSKAVSDCEEGDTHKHYQESGISVSLGQKRKSGYIMA